MAESEQERRGPTEISDPVMRNEVKKAAIWLGMAACLALVVILASPLLLIIGGLIVAIMLDGGTRLLGRILPIARGWRLALVLILATGFVAWTLYFTGSQLVSQAARLQIVVEAQIDQIGRWAASVGITATPDDLKQLGSEIASRIGQFTAAVTSVFGAIASFVLMCVLGIFIAIEPKLYERGLGWMIPLKKRAYFYGTLDHIGFTMRRLLAGRMLGMAVEGFGTWILLWLGGVPMAALLGLLTGVLAFLPNIGAIVSGVLIVLVGFSAGVETGLFAVGVYLFVQIIDGYVIVPMVAKKTVDLAPALVLGAQLIFGALFGIVGLALADPIVAIIKIALERGASEGEAESG